MMAGHGHGHCPFRVTVTVAVPVTATVAGLGLPSDSETLPSESDPADHCDAAIIIVIIDSESDGPAGGRAGQRPRRLCDCQ